MGPRLRKAGLPGSLHAARPLPQVDRRAHDRRLLLRPPYRPVQMKILPTFGKKKEKRRGFRRLPPPYLIFLFVCVSSVRGFPVVSSAFSPVFPRIHVANCQHVTEFQYSHSYSLTSEESREILSFVTVMTLSFVKNFISHTFSSTLIDACVPFLVPLCPDFRSFHFFSI